MSDVTRILSQIEAGDSLAAEQLLPLVYDELRKLATAKLAQEKPGQTLQATALVHEAYLRLASGGVCDSGLEPGARKSDVSGRKWDSRGHFFVAAAEAMRRILVENARRKQRIKHGGEQIRMDLDDAHLATSLPPDELILLNDAIDELASHDRTAAQLVNLRYFAGLSLEEAAEQIQVPRTTAYRHWTYARALLIARVRGSY